MGREGGGERTGFGLAGEIWGAVVARDDAFERGRQPEQFEHPHRVLGLLAPPLPARRERAYVDVCVRESPDAVLAPVDIVQEELESGGGVEDGVEGKSGVAVLVVV